MGERLDQYQKFFEEDLTGILQENLEDQTEDVARTLARECARNEPDAVDKVNQILAEPRRAVRTRRATRCATP